VKLPDIISVDDHVVEPPSLWQERLPAGLRERGPRVLRQKGRLVRPGPAITAFVEDPGADGAVWADVWAYDDVRWPLHVGFASVGPMRGRRSLEPVTYEEIQPGCFGQAERLSDMTLNRVQASVSFPTFPRFCGQTFAEREDKDFALRCLMVYNDWMIDEWCAGEGYGRLIPLTLVPLWDAGLAAAEVRRCAGKGSRSIAFSENPTKLGLPSVHSGYWEPLFQACQHTGTVINMQIGSSSAMPTTSPDAPVIVNVTLNFQPAMHAMVDWLTSGVLARYPGIRIALSEGQAGWMPFVFERLDGAWERSAMYDAGLRERVPEPPSSYVRGRVFGCIFDDVNALVNRERVGMGQLMFEVDYPHSDSTFPHSMRTAEKLVDAGGLSEHEAWQFVRGNAISCYNLQQYGITE
jgi:predicted TIM-barrel fold metal-dependent hydrolase